jgi:PAS domain S-box-containing protein
MVHEETGSRNTPGLKDTIRPSLIAVLAVAVASVIQWLLDPNNYKFTTLLGAVAVAVWYGGWPLAGFTAVLGYVAASYLFIESPGSLGRTDLAGLGAYVFSCAIITWLGTQMRNARKLALALAEKEDKREHFLSCMIDSVRDCFYAVDRDWRFTYINAAAAAYFGSSKTSLLGKSRWELFPGNRTGALHIALLRAMNEHVPVHFEGASTLTGHWIDLHAYPSPDGLSVFFTDAEERHNADKSRVRASQQLRTLVNNTPLAVVEWDKDFRVSQWSGEAESIFGWTAAEVSGRFMTDFPLIFEGDMDKVLETQRELQEGGKKYVICRNRNTTKSGKVIHCEWYNSILEGGDGKADAVLSLVLDVTERHHLQSELQRSLLKLKEEDRRKDEFLATLAHELRNPLAPLTSSLEVLRLAPQDPALRNRVCSVMTRQLSIMVRLIDDLLELSRITTGKLKLRRTKIEIAGVMREAVEAADPLIKLRQHELTVVSPGTPLSVYGDAARLAQVITNLLRNAAKFTDERGKIALSAERSCDKVIIRVRDNGAGIPPARLETIFEMFFQEQPAGDHGGDGLGIGLHLARRLVEMHDGKIAARSGGPGFGSEFTIELPCMADMEDACAMASTQSSTMKPLRLLVVDDNTDAADSMATLLKLDGHDAQAIYEGERACHVVEQLRPDVVLLDLGMPGMTGYEVARNIRQSECGRNLLLVAVSGWAGEEDRKKSLHAGFDFHVAKPVQLSQLKALLSAAASRPLTTLKT